MRGDMAASCHFWRSFVLKTIWTMTWLSDRGIGVIKILKFGYDTGRWPSMKIHCFFPGRSPGVALGWYE